jgi:hypothetical protein
MPPKSTKGQQADQQSDQQPTPTTSPSPPPTSLSLDLLLQALQSASSTSTAKQHIEQLNQKAEIWSHLIKNAKLAGANDWFTWHRMFTKYATALRIQHILKDSYEEPTPDTPDWDLWNAQDSLLQSFISQSIDNNLKHLINDAPTAYEQHTILKHYLDLGPHSQAYEAAKGLSELKFTDYQTSLSEFSTLANQIETAGVTTWQEAKTYLWMALINQQYKPAIESILTNPPPKWTFESVTKYFALKQPMAHRTQQQSSPTYDNPKCPHCQNLHRGPCWVLHPELRPPPRSQSKPQSEPEPQPEAEPMIGFSTTIGNNIRHNSTTWHIDSAADHHMTPNRNLFTTYKAYDKVQRVRLSNSYKLTIAGIGDIHLPNGIILRNAVHVPDLRTNLIALGQLDAYRPRYKNNTFTLHLPDHCIRIPRSEGVYPLTIPTSKSYLRPTTNHVYRH